MKVVGESTFWRQKRSESLSPRSITKLARTKGQAKKKLRLVFFIFKFVLDKLTESLSVKEIVNPEKEYANPLHVM